MNCQCGIPAFFYETIKSDGVKYSLYKCGAVQSDSKRGKCTFNLETRLNKIIFPTIEIKSPEIIHGKLFDTKIELYKNLENYIYLLEISKNNYGMSKNNYISNINFILKKLQLPLFFPDKEFLKSLKLRIYNIPNKTPIKNRIYPISIIEIPDHLKIENKKVIRKTKTGLRKTYDKFGIPKIILNRNEDILIGIKKLEIKSDSENESDSQDEEDNSFDIDVSDSEMEDNFCDDGGGLSD